MMKIAEKTHLMKIINIFLSVQRPCQRKFTIKLPDSYITNGKTPKKIYDAGTIQLAGAFPGEERDCLH
ncbi:hypothetical protein RB195_008996 [Necator americanus]